MNFNTWNPTKLIDTDKLFEDEKRGHDFDWYGLEGKGRSQLGEYQYKLAPVEIHPLNSPENTIARSFGYGYDDYSYLKNANEAQIDFHTPRYGCISGCNMEPLPAPERFAPNPNLMAETAMLNNPPLRNTRVNHPCMGPFAMK